MEYEQISKEEYDILKKSLGDGIHKTCDFCNKRITRANYGYISRDITSCKDIICVCGALDREDNIK